MPLTVSQRPRQTRWRMSNVPSYVLFVIALAIRQSPRVQRLIITLIHNIIAALEQFASSLDTSSTTPATRAAYQLAEDDELVPQQLSGLLDGDERLRPAARAADQLAEDAEFDASQQLSGLLPDGANVLESMALPFPVPPEFLTHWPHELAFSLPSARI